MTSSRLIGAREAAEIAGVRVLTIHEWIRVGRLPAIKLPGRTGAYVIERADLDALIDERRAS